MSSHTGNATLRVLALAALILLLRLGAVSAQQAAPGKDPLPSWNDGPAKARIVAFVKAVTDQGGPDFVPPAERIAVFDNDGTLWAEQPMHLQLVFALDRVKALAPQHSEWTTREPFKSVLANDLKGVMAGDAA